LIPRLENQKLLALIEDLKQKQKSLEESNQSLAEKNKQISESVVGLSLFLFFCLSFSASLQTLPRAHLKKKINLFNSKRKN